MNAFFIRVATKTRVLYAVIVSGMIGIASANTASALTQFMVPAKACWTENNLLTKPFGKLLELASGGVAGIISAVVVLLVLLLLLVGIVQVLRNKNGSEALRGILWVLLLPIAAGFLLGVYTVIKGISSNTC